MKTVKCDRPRKIRIKCMYLSSDGKTCRPKTRFNQSDEQFFCFEPKEVKRNE